MGNYRLISVVVALFCVRTAICQEPDTTRPDSVVALRPLEVVGSLRRALGPEIGSGLTGRLHVMRVENVIGADAGIDVIAQLPGVSWYDDLGSANKRTVVYRGFTVSPVVGLPQGLSVFVDGIPVNEPDAGQVNLDMLPLEHAQHIELLSGTAALLGPHSLGGALNIVTMNTAGTSAAVSGGSFGSVAAQLRSGGAVGGWDYYIGGSIATAGGWRQQTSNTGSSGWLNVTRGNDARGLRLQLGWASSYAETAGSLPESIVAEHPDSNFSAGDFEDLRQLHAALTAFMNVGRSRIAGSLYMRSNDAERFNVNQAADPDVRSFSSSRVLGGSAELRRELNVLPMSVAVGATGALSGSEVELQRERIEPGVTTRVRSPIAQFSTHVAADSRLRHLTLLAALRFDYKRIPFHNLLNPARDTVSTYLQLNPRIGLSWRLTERMDWFASWSRGFRAPALLELACADPEQPCPLPYALGDDPPLDAVRVHTAETGVRLIDARRRLDITAFVTRAHDEIFLVPYDGDDEPAGSTIDGYFRNLASTSRMGVELQAQLYSERYRAHASATFTRAQFESGDIEIFSIREADGRTNEIESGDRLPLVPAVSSSLQGAVKLAQAIWLSAGLHYTGQQYLRGDEANDEAPLPAYMTARGGAEWTFQNWVVELTVFNLFDSSAATFGTFNIHQSAARVERFLTPQQPRSFQLSLRREL